MEKIEFYNDGKYEKYNEINGMKQGKAVYYWGKSSDLIEKHEDYGKIKEEFFYENGVKQGKAITYFDQVKTKKIKEEFYYVDNVKQGEAYILYLDKFEKINYVNGKLTGKIWIYRINGKAEVKNTDDIQSGFKSLKEILGIEENKKEELSEQEYKILKMEAEKIFKETAELYKQPEKLNSENNNAIPELFIKKWYLRYKEIKF